MLRRTLLTVALATAVSTFVAVAWTAGGTPSAKALTNCDTTEAGITAAEQQMLTLINGARAASGLQALKLSPNLNRAAAWKSADRSAYATSINDPLFSHTDSLGRDPISYSPKNRPIDCGYAAGAAENIAFGSTNPQTIFNEWMASPGHRRNINGTRLNGTIDPFYYNYSKNYKVIGIGQHGTAWTTDFGNADDSGATAPPSAAPTQPTQRATSTPLATPSATATPTATNQPAASPRSFHATVPQVTHD